MKQHQFKPASSLLPSWLRSFIVRITGHENPAAILLRGLAWRYRYFLFLSLLGNLLAALFEAGTIASFTLTLEFFEGNSKSIESIPYVSPILEWAGARWNDIGIFFCLILMVVGSQIMRSWSDYSAQVATVFLGTWTEGDLRRRLFARFTKLTYSKVSRYKVGDLTSLIGEVERVGMLATAANQVLSHFTIILSYTIVLFWLSWQTAFLILIVLTVLSFMVMGIRKQIRKRSRNFMLSYVSINKQIVEYLQGIRLLHTFGRLGFARANVDIDINKSVRFKRQSQMLYVLIPTIIQSIAFIGLAIFLSAGYLWVQQSGDSSIVPRLTVFTFVIYRMLPRVTNLNSQAGALYQNIPFVMRIAGHLDNKISESVSFGTIPYTKLERNIEFKNVSLQYDALEKVAIDQLTTTFEFGKMYALVGSSGSGKSSIASLLLRLYEPTSGEILVDDQSLNELNRQDWIERIAVVDQDTFLLNASIRENIRFGRLDATDEEIISAAKIANAHRFIIDLADKYDTVVGDRGVRLSGGQRQRLAIARAVVRHTDIFLFDEATSALDSISEQLIQHSVESLRHNHILIVIAHRLSTISHADNILVMHEGQIAEQGTHSQLLQQKGRYYSMWRLQSSDDSVLTM